MLSPVVTSAAPVAGQAEEGKILADLTGSDPGRISKIIGENPRKIEQF